MGLIPNFACKSPHEINRRSLGLPQRGFTEFRNAFLRLALLNDDSPGLYLAAVLSGLQLPHTDMIAFT
jgi:hypothetical protein